MMYIKYSWDTEYVYGDLPSMDKSNRLQQTKHQDHQLLASLYYLAVVKYEAASRQSRNTVEHSRSILVASLGISTP